MAVLVVAVQKGCKKISFLSQDCELRIGKWFVVSCKAIESFILGFWETQPLANFASLVLINASTLEKG